MDQERAALESLLSSDQLSRIVRDASTRQRIDVDKICQWLKRRQHSRLEYNRVSEDLGDPNFPSQSVDQHGNSKCGHIATN